MVTKSGRVLDRGSVWSWPRTREAVMVLAAVMASFGVLIAGVTYAVQPSREDVRALQATMGDVRERLVRVEEGQARLEKDVARVLVLLERAPGGWIVSIRPKGAEQAEALEADAVVGMRLVTSNVAEGAAE